MIENFDFDKLLDECDSSHKGIATELVGRLRFIRARLDDLEKLPFIEVKPGEPQKQRPTPAAKQYKELSQQYNSYIQTLLKTFGKKDDNNNISPLREYFQKIEKRSETHSPTL